MFRRFLPVAAVGALLFAAPSAQAFSPTVYPTATTPTMPGTSRMVDTWKYVGTWKSSAVQIAPRWVLSSDHSSIPAGETFQNSWGSAVVLKQYRPAIGDDERRYVGIDLTLEYLATPIAAPGPFPTLLDEQVDEEIETGLPGWVLNTGFGRNGTTGPNPYTPTVAWTTPYGTTKVSGTVYPEAKLGDSGGGQFWFPRPDSAPILSGIISSGLRGSLGAQQAVGGIQQVTNERVRDFMDAAFAERESEPNATPPTFTSLESHVGPIASLKPGGVGLSWAESVGATSVRVAWLSAPARRIPRTGYKILFNGVVKAITGPDETSINVTGLKWFTSYKVRIVSTGPSGDAISIPNSDSFSVLTFW